MRKLIDGKENKYKGRLKTGRESLIEFTHYGFIPIWPFYPEDQFNYYGAGKHSLSEAMTYINMPLKPTEKQLKKLRELASILVYNRDVKEVYTSRMNEKNIPYDAKCYKGKDGKNPKELLQDIDDELLTMSNKQY